ncbi:hypothetical protein [Azospirillum argentinense]|uniref:Uncharacterized protein n=1 Tax=Azospirillum argentinense TaxID=2970906 RepID=A0A5B0KTE4_9PROT|nr:hypothetical protein FH063_006259 [Azospirillum argentinense]
MPPCGDAHAYGEELGRKPPRWSTSSRGKTAAQRWFARGGPPR